MKNHKKIVKKEKIFNLRIVDVWKLNQEKELEKKDKNDSLSKFMKCYPIMNSVKLN